MPSCAAFHGSQAICHLLIKEELHAKSIDDVTVRSGLKGDELDETPIRRGLMHSRSIERRRSSNTVLSIFSGLTRHSSRTVDIFFFYMWLLMANIQTMLTISLFQDTPQSRAISVFDNSMDYGSSIKSPGSHFARHIEVCRHSFASAGLSLGSFPKPGVH